MRRRISFMVVALLLLVLPAAARYGVKKIIPLGVTGAYTHSLVFSSQHSKVNCSNTGSGTISAIDATQGSLLVNIPIFNPGEMVYAETSDRLFVHDMDTYLGAISGSSDSIVGVITYGQGWCDLAYNRLQDRLYASNSIDGLAFFSGSNLDNLGYNSTVNGNIFFAEPIQKLYGIGDTLVYVLDGASNAVIDSFVVPGIDSNSLFDYNPAAQKLYITTASGRLCVINTVNDDVIDLLQLGASVAAMAYCPLNNNMYMALTNGDLAEVTPEEGYILYLTGNSKITGVVYNPSDSLIYIIDSVNVMLFDPRTRVFKETVRIPGSGVYTNLVATNKGNSYITDINYDQAYVVRKESERLWRSNTSNGQWQDYSSWVYSDDGGMSWGNQEMTYPWGPEDSTILIGTGDTILLTEGNIEVDELVVNGVLAQLGASLEIVDGPGVDMAVAGEYQFSGGMMTKAPTATIAFADYAKYIHNVNGGTIPQAQWQPLSILQLTQVQDSVPSGLNQQFGKIIWNCSSQFNDAVLPGGPLFLLHGLEVLSTGYTGRLVLTSSTKPELTINGNLVINGSSSRVMAGGSGIRKLVVNGNLEMINSPSLAVYDSDSPGICTLRIRGDYRAIIAKGGKGLIGPSGPDSAAVVFDGGGRHNIVAFSDLNSGFVDFIVEPGNTINIGQDNAIGLGSQGRFWLMPGAYLRTSDTLGAWVSADLGCIRNFGPRIFGPGAGFIFSEGMGRGVSGDAVAGDVSMIRAANPFGTKLLRSVNILDSLVLQGPLDFEDTLTLSGELVSFLNGVLGYKPGAVLQIAGTGSNIDLQVKPTDTLGTLTINRPGTVTLDSSMIIKDRLNLHQGILNYSGTTTLTLGDSIEIRRSAFGSLSGPAPNFLGVASLTYKGGLNFAGPEMPTDSTVLWNLSIPDSMDGLVMSSQLVVNGTLNLGGTLTVDNSIFILKGPIITSGNAWLYNIGASATTAVRGSGIGAIPNFMGRHLEIDRPAMLPAFGDIRCYGSLRLLNGSMSLGAHSLFIGDSLVISGGSLSADSLSSIIFGYGSGAVSLPPSVLILDSLVLGNPNGLALSNNLTIKNKYVQTAGRITAGTLHYRPGADLVYRLSSPDMTSGAEFPSVDGPTDLVIQSGMGNVTLHDSRTVPGQLSLLEGILETGPETLFVAPGGSALSMGGYVFGNLAKHFQTGSQTRGFEVGTPGNQYSPVNLQLFNSTQSGYVTVSAVDSYHPQVDSAANCLNRYWRISGPGIFCDSSVITFTYLPEDFSATFIEALYESTMVVGRYGSSGNWQFPPALSRLYNGPNDGGSITVAGGGNFDDNPEFTTGRDQASIHTSIMQDTVPPAAPLNLLVNGADPMPWTRNDTLLLTWSNPEPGISAAYYKIGMPPLANYDTTGRLGDVGGSANVVFAGQGWVPIYVWLADSLGNMSYLNFASATIRADKSAPLGAVVKPFVPDTVMVSDIDVRWSPGFDGFSGVMGWRVLYRVDTSVVWETLTPWINDTTFMLVGALRGHRYYFEAAACDSAGNWESFTGISEASVYVAPLAVDTVGPTVVATEPMYGADDIPLDFPINIIFSEPVRKASLGYSFYPSVVTDSLIWHYDSTMVTIYHRPFQPSRRCTVVISMAQDTAGNLMQSPYTFWFTTVAVADSPQIVLKQPTNGQRDVPLSFPVTIKFSEPMDTASFRFYCNPAVSGWATSWLNADSTVVLTHNGFQPGTIYTFRVNSAASKAGIPLNTTAPPNQPWSFTTIIIPGVVSAPWAGGAWRLFSIPTMPQDTTALGLLGDDLGAYSDTTWRLVGYKPNRGYIELPAITPGYGYWLASTFDATLDVQGAPLYQPWLVPLDSGWNIVGNPFDTALYLGGLMIRWADSLSHQYYYNEPQVDSVLRQLMWYYNDPSPDLINNGTWDSLSPFSHSARMLPWRGYAVYAVRPCTLVMERNKKGGEKQNWPLAQMDWQLELSAFMGAWADRGLRVGISPQASLRYDRLDAEKPPLVSENLAIYLPHDDWGQGPCRRYLRDIRPPGTEQRWLVKVDARMSQPIEIYYALSGNLDPGYKLYLVDRRLGQGQPVNGSGRLMMSRSGYLEIIYTSRGLEELEFKPLEFGLTRIYPNPFQGRTAISFQLDRNGWVSLKIYNSLGQLTAVLFDGHREAGFHTVVWDSHRAAAGIYLVKLESEGRTRVTKTVKLR